MRYTNFSDYIGDVIAHMNNEYENGELFGELNDIQKYEIRNRLFDHYNNNDSTSNAAGNIINYIRGCF
jgi:hypothetical protein